MKVLRLKIICLLILIFLPGSLSSDSSPRVLLINSDTTVEKYEVAGNEFKKALPHPVVEVHLDKKKWRISDIEEMIYDEDPDLIYCIGTKAYLIANKYANETDRVFSSIINWQRLPMTQKTYGVSSELHSEMQITLFRYILPEIKKIGVLYSDKYNRQWFNETRAEAGEIGIEIIGKPVTEDKKPHEALKELLPSIDALWLIADPLIVTDKNILKKVFEECDSKKVPVISYHDIFVDYGAVLIISVDNPTIGRQAASIAAEVLSHEKLDEHIQYPAGSHIIFNLRKVKEYGVVFKKEALSLVNQIVE